MGNFPRKMLVVTTESNKGQTILLEVKDLIV